MNNLPAVITTPESKSLRNYRLLTQALAPLASFHLKNRLRKGREDAARWQEKLGQAGQARPQGRLIWLNAVGLGEVMALRGLIEAMGRADPDAHFLITSSARSSAQVIATNLPARTIHQYLPLDAPTYVARFLDHWQPDLSIWAEQEIWPNAVHACDQRGIPLVLLNARITAESAQKRGIIKAIYRDVLPRFQRIIAQDAASAAHLQALGASDVAVMASLKCTAPMLQANATELSRMQNMFKARKVWVAASTHIEDESIAEAAQQTLFAADPSWLLVLVPRDPKRNVAVPMPFVRRSADPDQMVAPIYLADSFGELGLWYRLASAALIGGSFGAIQGHNPWEAAALGCAVLHGPRVGNFTADYAALHVAGAAREVADSAALASALQSADLVQLGLRGQSLVRRAAPLDDLAGELLGMLRD
ncbi:3-deoxy-D-manno-octulosonic acid transferase [Pseudorhodobacter sp. W20_MBD10_FR17]|uniref:3-deoxy-D-manno-octulosonic acid transferase n=1 Tax=Pseudorhodobacter sp. W20_MBD10_FR17 TaxID=3240266 RepID=UPI003F9DB254